MKKWIVAIAVLTLGTTIGFALPQHDAGGEHAGREHHGRPDFAAMLAERLNLTDTQKQQVAAIDKTTHEENGPAFEKMRSTMKEFFDAKQANDTAKLESLKPAMEEQRATMKKIHDAEVAKVMDVLTAEQKAQLKTLEAEHEEHQHKQ